MKMITLCTILLLSGTAQAGWYCLAFPSGSNNGRRSSLPGYGHERSLEASRAAAIRSCLSRNSWAWSCKLNGCSPE